MISILIGLTFIAGIIIHILVTHLPTLLQRSWSNECMAYLKDMQKEKFEHLTSPQISFPQLRWRQYLPFFSIRFLFFDIVLFACSLIIFYYSNSFFYLIFALFFTWLLLTSSFIDFEHQILPDELTYILLWLGLASSCWNLFTDSKNAILGAFIAYASLFVISLLFKIIRKKEGMGQGDLKLFAAIGAWTGIIYLPLILFMASFSSIIFILFRKIIVKKAYSAPVPFGPFLAFSAWLVLLCGPEITHFIFH